MEWLAETAPRRGQPTAMWPEAQSAIVLTMNYGPDHDPMDNLARAPMAMCLSMRAAGLS